MELIAVFRMMKSYNPDAVVNVSTSDGDNVQLTWCYMGITHRITHLNLISISMSNQRFQRSMHQARIIMRCRTNLRKIYQNHPDIHLKVMKGELR